MEMSGLDVSQCRILEVAAVVTDRNFRTLESYEAIVFQEPEVLAAMDEWCQKQHGDSGLKAAVATGKPESLVEQELLALVERHFQPKDRPILCGNSIGQDRKFIERYMMALDKRLHYRMVDVTSFKVILAERGVSFAKKDTNHRALGDIQQSIAELEHYLSHFNTPQQ
jgi:oligoribonuclease